MSILKTIGRGLVAGTWGVLAMAGVSFTTRRMVEPTAVIGKTHYESVVENAHRLTGADTELDPETRIRIGEIAHLGFGAFWGMVFAVLTRNRQIHPVPNGLSYGTAIWLAAFGGYMPALKISRSLWQMQPYEAFRTWISHAVFGVATFLALRNR